MSPQEITVAAIFAQPDNAGVLRLLELQRAEDVRHFIAGTDGSPFDEGGMIFFHRYGRLIPAAARCTIDICNVLVHERTARIFAVHHGRFTIALRPDMANADAELFGPLCRETMDGLVDLTALGPGWMTLSADDEDDAAQEFLRAYAFAGRI